ncbi:pre-B-cell leukemia transcription factor-interacting protein 1 isoform X3 [Erinaceus europaeus]|uniref:Pre-B-cell leukemia transcription factor-interacting protein 1 isoform X3 n=1 Tax=Erinaceus europaeus TaxID=9365 RepID=A0ABM3Y8X1_ERIEU|nr:pre-B-cell leukemia transcription factor-interacting protein 1 isoform X3 [Erinaceus europaeus]
MAASPDSDNSWVLAGSESLPVETLGPESRMDPEAERASPVADGPSAGEEPTLQRDSVQADPTPPKEEKAKGTPDTAVESPGLENTVTQGDLEKTPLEAELDTQDPEGQSTSPSLPSSPKTVWPKTEGRCTSSEDDTDVDVEGLRRRRGREHQPVASLGVEEQAGDEGASWELGISLNMCLLGALLLLGLGILLFSGGLSESENGPGEEVDLQVFPDSGSDTELPDAVHKQQNGASQQPLAAAAPNSVPSLQSMVLLLDKLAKENQDIRLLQAQLQSTTQLCLVVVLGIEPGTLEPQTQKEELQSLMLEPKGLEEENAQLRGALLQGEASQRALELELQQLRARLQGLEADCTRGPDGVCLSWGSQPRSNPGSPGQQQGPSLAQQRLENEAQALRRELERQRQLLGAVQQDLEQGLRHAGQGDLTRVGLAELGRRLAQKLEALQHRGPGEAGVSTNASGAWQQEPRTARPRERGRREMWHDGKPGDQRNQRHEHWKSKKEESKKNWGDEAREPQGQKGGERKEGKWQGSQEHPWKSRGPHSGEKHEHPRWKEGPKDREALSLWAELSRHKYRAPQGCSGVWECARQEGLTFFGTELAPVKQQELASLLTTYLARLPWARPLSKELPLSPTYFGEDGFFRHDRLHFRDFVDALEDSLEEVAVQQTGDDDEVDDFEDFIYRHFFGERAQKKRSGKKDKHKHKHTWSSKVARPWEEHGPRHRD